MPGCTKKPTNKRWRNLAPLCHKRKSLAVKLVTQGTIETSLGSHTAPQLCHHLRCFPWGGFRKASKTSVFQINWKHTRKNQNILSIYLSIWTLDFILTNEMVHTPSTAHHFLLSRCNSPRSARLLHHQELWHLSPSSTLVQGKQILWQHFWAFRFFTTSNLIRKAYMKKPHSTDFLVLGFLLLD